MVMYLSEKEAQNEIEQIAKDITTDVRITLVKRKQSSLIEKKVIFAISTSAEKGEELYDAFVIKAIKSGKKIEVIESEVVADDKKLKDILFVSALIKVQT